MAALSARRLAAVLLVALLVCGARAHYEPDGDVPVEDSPTATGDPDANVGDVGPEPGSPADAATPEPADEDGEDIVVAGGLPQPRETPAPGAEDPSAAATPGVDDDDADADEEDPVSVAGSADTDDPITRADPTPDASDEEDDDDDDGSACFPADATVTTRARGAVRMADLQVGDDVLVAPGVYSPVFMFTHREPAGRYAFVTLETAAGARLSVSAGHYLHAGGSLVAARAVRVGDELVLADGTPSAVVSVAPRTAHGLFNPQTVHGDVVVDGVLASTYTDAVAPPLAHGLLAPLRAAYSALGAYTSAFDAGSDALAAVAPSGSAVVV